MKNPPDFVIYVVMVKHPGSESFKRFFGGPAMATNGDGYVTPMEAARLAGFSRKHIYELLTTGKLRGVKVWGDRWRVRLEDVKALKASRELGGAQ